MNMSLEESIIKLYTSIKLKLESEVLLSLKKFPSHDFSFIEKENEFFEIKNPKDMIDYLENFIENLNFKIISQESNENSTNEEELNPYEVSLRQLEAEIRNHIKLRIF